MGTNDPSGARSDAGADRETYPLRSLFLLVAISGVLLSLLAPLNRAYENRNGGGADLAAAAAFGAFFTMGLALLIFAVNRADRSRSGWVLAGLVGLVVGGICGPIIGVVYDGVWRGRYRSASLYYRERPQAADPLIENYEFFVALVVASVAGSVVLLLMAWVFRRRSDRRMAESPFGHSQTAAEVHAADPQAQSSSKSDVRQGE